jgi:hypothetical protein
MPESTLKMCWRNFLKAAAVLGLCCVAALVPASRSFAQMYEPSYSYAAGYAPKGIPLGGFRLFPTLDLGTTYDDNIYLTQTQKQGDLVFQEEPGFLLKSQWQRNELDLYGAMTAFQYVTNTSEDHIDGTVGGNGRLDVWQGTDISGGASYSILHLANSSPLLIDVPTHPSQFAQTAANAAFTYQPYHFGFSAGVNFTRYDFDPTQFTGFSVNNSDLDENIYNPYLKLFYEFSPGYSVFVRGDYNAQVYDQTRDRNGLRRNSDGDSINAGLQMKVTPLVSGQVFAGYLQQRYEAPFGNVSGVDFGANVDWTPTAFWTFHLTASRSLNETIIASASTEDDEMARLGVDYAVLRNLTVSAQASYWYATFPGSSRIDRYPEAGVSVTYYMTHGVSATASYVFQKRDSTVFDQNFNDNRIMLDVNLHL